MRPLVFLIFLLVLTSCGSDTITEPTASSTCPFQVQITGRVTHSCSGLPISEAEICIVQGDMNVVTTSTLHNGLFVFDNLEFGTTYTVICTPPANWDGVSEVAREVVTPTFDEMRDMANDAGIDRLVIDVPLQIAPPSDMIRGPEGICLGDPIVLEFCGSFDFSTLDLWLGFPGHEDHASIPYSVDIQDSTVVVVPPYSPNLLMVRCKTDTGEEISRTLEIEVWACDCWAEVLGTNIQDGFPVDGTIEIELLLCHFDIRDFEIALRQSVGGQPVEDVPFLLTFRPTEIPNILIKPEQDFEADASVVLLISTELGQIFFATFTTAPSP